MRRSKYLRRKKGGGGGGGGGLFCTSRPPNSSPSLGYRACRTSPTMQKCATNYSNWRRPTDKSRRNNHERHSSINRGRGAGVAVGSGGIWRRRIRGAAA